MDIFFIKSYKSRMLVRFVRLFYLDKDFVISIQVAVHIAVTV